VLGHAGVGFLKGGYVGVDVFFVLSGFLITGILLSRAAKTGYVSLSDFYIRRARRILPAAALTLVATDIAAYYLLNFVRAKEAVTDSIWAAFFGANIQFARQGTDYFAQGQPPSPIQHFWSLAVEEQFYLVWPALLSLVVFGAVFGFRRHHHRGDPAQTITERSLWRLLIVIVLVGLGSLAWSIHSTSLTPASAYFSTFARAWELALGAALAIAAPNLRRLPTGVSAAVGWLGLAGIACAAVLYSDSTRFPGYAALLPTLGAALVIGAGIRKQQSRFGAARVLAVPPLCYVGDRSYAYYLWHWSVLVIAVQYVGHDLSVGVKLLLMFGAFLLSIISYAAFENPIRHMRWRAPVGALLWPASVAVVLAVALVTLSSIDDKAGRLEAAAAAVKPTPLVDPELAEAAEASATALPAVVRAVKAAQRGAPLPSPLTPAVSQLLKDVYDFPEGCVPHTGETSSKICRMGDTTSLKKLVVMGDSHMQMWMPTILRMADRDGWLVLPIVKSSCTPGNWLHSRHRECPAWYRWGAKQAKALRPDVTLVAGDWGPDTPVDAAIKTISTLTSTMKKFSKSVIVLGDPPPQRRQPVDCLLAAGATMKTCTARITKAQLYGDIRISSAAKKHHVGFMSSRGWFCARTSTKKLVYLCPLVVNRTITHRDRDHVTTTYALELLSPFRGAFRRALFQ
jgi:peptidoglycan/LPS O-acetylase OafA/YrhL